MKEELQKEYDVYLTELKKINKIKAAITKKIHDAGYIINAGKVQTAEMVYGIFYDMKFYSHFDGHKGCAVIDIESGVKKVDKVEFDILKNCLETKNYDSIGNLYNLNIYFPKMLEYCENVWEYFTIINDNEIHWKYTGDGDIYEKIASGSYFTIKLCSHKTIIKTKNIEKTIYE